MERDQGEIPASVCGVWKREDPGPWCFWGRAPGIVGAVAEKGPPVGEVSAESLSVGKGQGAGQGGSGLPGPFDPERQAGVTWRLELALAHCCLAGPHGFIKSRWGDCPILEHWA